ncbi:Ser-Thr-rich glycosyl-phosphatidyl-inositol-anchored membrane family-domain-containing protein [Boeremia exigua]|uniref:Ser-Thr-rich glycosyl-phosphatidyl-inositol-anchored membrane family-domain-containing protein n=1 Tax=Boeremia exigua TaxID=749465 RepID=UPI001E8E8964|nr:Ser-Thr-rich glycosyl-phosphatidyl-inositol-anchored membrane family-domain-containing protein [Boeremia exigua]KAH6638168.1 Ser-Thr-rich glycosyl-phosphatidyl-inositol-anchored membrane family-domain-containing protein [Boeremia exigua]
MRFFQMVASSAAFIAAALALEINQYPTGGVRAGQTYTITYSPADNTPTTFILRKGLSTNLGTIGTLTTTATGGSYSWTVASDLADGADYALEIQQQGETPNYSGQFGLTGGSAAASSSAASSASASSASASSVASVISSRASSASAASASLSSLISSAVSSVQATATGTGAVTASSNGTISSATLSRSATRTSSSSTGSASIPESTGAASSLSSAPLALLLGAVGAFAFLN